MNKWMPDRKVLAGGLVAVLVWFLLQLLAPYGVVFDAGQQEIIAGLVGLLIQYLVPPSAKDIVKRIDDDILKLAGAQRNPPPLDGA